MSTNLVDNILRRRHRPRQMNETFLPHPLHPQCLVGSLGSIKSTVVDPDGRLRKQFVKTNGYVVVGLATGISGQPAVKYVHRLVAETHVPNPLGLKEVNHINHQKADNRAANLEWIGHADNLRKARAHHGNWVTGVKVRKAVIATPLNGGPEIEWVSARAWALSTGNAKRAANISKAIRTNQPAYGYTWRFKAHNNLGQQEL